MRDRHSLDADEDVVHLVGGLAWVDALDELVDDLVEARAGQMRDDARPRDDRTLVERCGEALVEDVERAGRSVGRRVKLAEGELHADLADIGIDGRADAARARVE